MLKKGMGAIIFTLTLKRMSNYQLPVCILSLLCLAELTSCGPTGTASPLNASTETALGGIPTMLNPTGTPSLTPTPQPHLTLVTYGPELEKFPPGYSPLTGRPVQDPALLDLPPVLVSISNMPVTARPQAGPSFAPWVFEFFIGEGTTRFMGVFYGDYPRYIPDVTGGCPVRSGILNPSEPWAGNRVWLDENRDGKQDAWEVGIGGVCVRLYEADSGKLIQNTSTDSNGYYAFSITPGVKYVIEFPRPQTFEFTLSDTGNDDQDSDAEAASGRTQPFTAKATDTSWDAGLILLQEPTITPSPVVTGTPPGFYIPAGAYAGPIRSGRLTYNHIGDMFPGSCLVYASAGRGIREALHGCEIVFGADIYDMNSAVIEVSRMQELARENREKVPSINYSGNLFADIPPAGGQPATNIWVFYHRYSQSLWEYDPISETYLRQTDQADGSSNFHPATERLSGRQLAFENVIAVEAEYAVVRYLQYDIDLRMGNKGYAYLFRDGQVYQIYWSTRSREWEKNTGLLRPIHFEDADGNPVPLKPGRTWIHLVTPGSYLEEQENGMWKVNFIQPYDPPPK